MNISTARIKTSYLRAFLFFVTEISIFSLFMVFYCLHSVLWPPDSRLYSKYFGYRLQTNALLEGKLSLSSRPIGFVDDFDYSEHGMQQNWGLGVPILRLPFEWYAKTFGDGYFPDRMVLVFYVCLVILILHLALGALIPYFDFTYDGLISKFVRWGATSWIFFSPVVAGPIQLHFKVCEEPIFYGCLYGCVLLCLLWLFLKFPSWRIFLFLALLSGFACLIRPTLIIYGAMSVGLGIYYAYQKLKDPKFIIAGILCFSLGVIVDLGSNYVHFGSMSEFGYSDNITTVPVVNYVLEIENPFKHESISNAFQDLFSALFLNYKFIALTFFRIRPRFDPCFNLSHLAVIMAAIFIFLFSLRRKNTLKDGLLYRIVIFSSIWGGVCFVFLFGFYLYANTLASRYLTDFLPAYFALSMACFFYALGWAAAYKNKALALFCVLIAASMVFYLNNNMSFKYRQAKFDTLTKVQVKKMIDDFYKETSNVFPLPETYYCLGSYPHISKHADPQFRGWDISKSCSVSYASVIFMPSRPCVTVNYTILSDPDILEVRIKRGAVFLKQRPPDSIVNNGHGQRIRLRNLFVPTAEPLIIKYCRM